MLGHVQQPNCGNIAPTKPNLLRTGVSPEFRLRPLLSGDCRILAAGVRRRVSPEFRLRPLLSVHGIRPGRGGHAGVAGVQAPAFVERPCSPPLKQDSSRVAGVQAPAFVERGTKFPWHGNLPSCVAGVQAPAFVERVCRCSTRSPRNTGVAGVQAPAFVERTRRSTTGSTPWSCRRSSGSGLC